MLQCNLYAASRNTFVQFIGYKIAQNIECNFQLQDHMTTLQKQLNGFSLSFWDNGLTVGSYIHHLTCSSEHTVTCQEAQKSLIDYAISICSNLANYLPIQPSIISWKIKTAKQLFRKGVFELTQEQHRPYFHASKALSSYLDRSFMEKSEEKIIKIQTSSVGPCIFSTRFWYCSKVSNGWAW